MPQGPAGLDGALPHVCHPPGDLLVPTARGEPRTQATIHLGHLAAPAPEDLCSAPSELLQPRSWGGGGGSGDLSPTKSFLSLSSLKVIEEEQGFPQLSYSWVPLIQALCRDIREET